MTEFQGWSRAAQRGAWWASSGLLAGACIVPDTDIAIQPRRTNPGTVRIVQAVALTTEADEACAQEPGLLLCPMPPDTVVPGLIEVENQAFCTCETGRDLNALGGFDIYVEDPDVDEAGNPEDDIFGVFLLDLDEDADDERVAGAVAYTNYLPSNQPALRVPLGEGTYAQPIGRPPTNVKSWTIGVETTVDLCNNNNGASLEPGLHALRLMVTDRPWALQVLVDEDGQPARDDDGFVRDEQSPPMVGVPDTPAGASYAIANYVFRCVDESSTLGATVCACEEDAG